MTNAQTNFSLLSFIFADVARHPLRVLLFIAVLISAVVVILSAHHNRQMSIALEKLMQQQDHLDVEWRHLVLEQSSLTEHNRIESLVEKKLGMRRPEPSEEIVVRIK